MEVSLTSDQKPFIRQAIETGRLQHEEEAVREALSLWEEREPKRAEFLTSLEMPKPRQLKAKDALSPNNPCGNLPRK
jgi:putative addiction module CopG family antidote